ncbi:SLBB domain-containing protein [Fibrobacterota bacterium]
MLKSPIKPVLPFILAMILPSFGQSGLEDKITQRQLLQEQGITNLTPAQIDSLKRLKRGQDKQKIEGQEQTTVLDSLIQGPVKADSLGLLDTGLAIDTMPRRYSQRIFSRSPSALFGSFHSSVGKSHILGAGDEITVSLWGDKEKQYNVALNPAGKVFLEGIGLVKLEGYTAADAEDKLKKKFSRIYSGIRRGTAHVEVSKIKPGPVKAFVLGEVQLPGGYVFSGNTSILSAFYYAKGPTDIGTVRNIKLTRGKNEFFLDLYEYLLRGNTLSPNNLQDGDILFSGRAELLVEIDGDVGRPAIYELKKGEGIKELLAYAGHLNPTAATHRITLKRIFEDGRLDFLDLPPPQDFLSGKAQFELKDGDHLLVEESSELSEKFITVTGPVKYEGTYQSEGLKTVSDLIEKAGGLKEEAYLGRVHILRFQTDGSSELFSYSLKDTTLESIALQGKDNVILYSKKDMFAPDSVEIAGAVLNPGKYLYSKGMTVKGLVLRAGGFLPSYERGRAICFRPKTRDRQVESHTVKLDGGLEDTGEEFELVARDFVLIPDDPHWYNKEVVTLAGQFKYPGKYSLLFPGERLSAVISRAGGLKKDAYALGFRFFRKQNKVGRIGIDLERALNKPKGQFNVQMMGGDSIFIPEKQMTVKVRGEVGFPTSVLYKKGGSVKYYISRAGGFTRLSDKKRVILEYANGETTSDFYRKPDPGSVIFVPSRPEPEPIDWFKGINAVVATLGASAALILSIIAINRALE